MKMSRFSEPQIIGVLKQSSWASYLFIEINVLE